jgi:hypothetical protein
MTRQKFNSTRMRQIIIITFSISFLIASCRSPKRSHDNLQILKIEQIRRIIKVTNFIQLPLKFDANQDNQANLKYHVDQKGLDSLLFDSDLFDTYGCFVDTTTFFAFLANSVGDMLYPTIITFDKQGNRIDRKMIATANCLVNPRYDVKSCFDSVFIRTDLTFYSFSKFIGSIASEDSSPEIFDVCNQKELNGEILKNGQILIKEGQTIDCNVK